MKTIQDVIFFIINFINYVLVPLIFAIAFLAFLWGIYKGFLRGGDTAPKDREEGKKFAQYAIIGFAIMVSVWGLVNILLGTFNFDTNTRPCLPTFGKQANCSGGASNSPVLNSSAFGGTTDSSSNYLINSPYDAPKSSADSSGVYYNPNAYGVQSGSNSSIPNTAPRNTNSSVLNAPAPTTITNPGI